VKFRQAIENTPHLANAWKAGLGALRARDKPHVKAEDTTKLSGSAYVDEELKRVPNHAQAHRWDYAIAYEHTNRQAECIYWVETHTASTSEVDVVLAKLRWLKQWLNEEASELSHFEREYIWVSSGATHYSLNAPQKKAFAQLGLRQCGGVLSIRKERH
jgi:hypothetical protein